MENSGVKRCLEPSMKERKSTPSSSTCARRSFLAARISPSVNLATSMARTFLKRSEEHTSELQSRFDLVCRLLLEKKNIKLQISCISWSDITVALYIA